MMADGRKIRMGRIDYMNVWPVYHGFDTEGVPEGLELISAPPAGLNRLLEEGKLDISAISAHAYGLHHNDWLLVPDLGIGCDGRVMSVLLVSRRPFFGLSGATVRMTQESASAASLTKLLFHESDIHVRFETGPVRSPDQLGDRDAGVVIGDAALSSGWQEEFPYIYDLATLWKERSGFPFVFGLWAVRKEVAKKHPEAVGRAISLLLASRGQGVSHLEDVIRRAVTEGGLTPSVARDYFSTLQYDLPQTHVAGLECFFRRLKKAGLMKERVPLAFFSMEGPFLPELEFAS